MGVRGFGVLGVGGVGGVGVCGFSCLGVWGLGCGVEGLVFRVRGLGVWVWALRLRVEDSLYKEGGPSIDRL